MRDVSICILPAFSIAEFLGDDFPRLNSESIADFLRQIRVGHATKYLYVRHSVIINSWLCVQIIFDEGLMHQSFVLHWVIFDFQHELVNVKRTHYIRCKLVSPLEAVVIRVFSPYAESLLEILCMCESTVFEWWKKKKLKDFQMVVNLKTRIL